MTTLADRVITSLRANHDQLATRLQSLSDDQLTGPSGADEWSVAQVLSHLGSGAEIGLAGYRAALDGTEAPGDDFNRSVWARWDSSTPQEQAAGFLTHNARLVELLESLSPEQRETLQIKLGFLPAPLPLASIAGMRLSEAAQHQWDVEVAFDPAATLDADAAAVLMELFSDHIGFLLGFIGKADAVAEPAIVQIEGTHAGIVVDDSVSLTSSISSPTATLHAAPEAVIRLIGGRLRPEHTPSDVSIEGNVSLDELRRVFPGF